MGSSASILLLTGPPGIGKSTAIKKAIDLIGENAGGFYTREVRKKKQRIGFEIITLNGKKCYLATKDKSVDFEHQVIFSKYKVNIDCIHSVAIPALIQALEESKIIVIDEIGPMEIFSEKFCETIVSLLNNPQAKVLGTIVERSWTFADWVKSHPRTVIRYVTVENRDTIPFEISSAMLKSI